jgi:hypothetical protein
MIGNERSKGCMTDCKVREQLERQIVEAYKAIEAVKLDAPRSTEKAQAKLNRLIRQQHAHLHKNRCG